MDNRHKLLEIFSSVQGEGPYLGYRQIFIRYAHCNLNCVYCDTSTVAHDFCSVKNLPGKKDICRLPNPLSTSDVLNLINRWKLVVHHSVSFTGGEPLLNSLSLKELMNSVKAMKLKIFLETNGTLSEQLNEIIDLVDIISMDIKLPGHTGEDLFEQHREFLKIAIRKKVYVKIVITDNISQSEFLRSVDLIKKIDKRIPLIIQPVTPNQECYPPLPDQILMLQEKALEKLENVRVIPQAHILMGQL